MMKVILGMSGGVDSSTAAFILKERGFEVIGLSLLLFETRGRKDPKSCCSLESVRDAARSAKIAEIEHRTVNARIDFMEKVMKPFAEAYANGFTPNPCILCNKYIKFPLLLAESEKTGADFIATGHYARVERNGEILLKKGIDEKKDQSYVLYELRKKELARLVLPLGDFRKEDVRRIARGKNLPVFNRPESQEICFVEGRDYLPYVELFAPEAASEGPIFEESGKEIGRHKGIHRYTIGQRKGLGISNPKPLYVYRIDTQRNAIYAGSEDKALISNIRVENLNWLKPVHMEESFRCSVKVRSMMKASPAFASTNEEYLDIAFDEPQWAPAPGQSAVLFEGDTVLGGGIITKIEEKWEK